MRIHRFLAVLAALAAFGGTAAAEDTGKRVQASRAAVKAFAGELKGALRKAFKAGGPVAAIEVCQLKAPAIAAAHGERTGWAVGRTSLKLRNPNNAPDAWERMVLQEFEARLARGENIRALEKAAFTTLEGKQVFRFMKAIPTGKLCLQCHGANLRAPVKKALSERYPDDKATGFKLGQIRGAFTITQPR